jgi:hypothetical protein
VDGFADHLFLTGRCVEPLQHAAQEEAPAEAPTVTETVVTETVVVVVVPSSHRREPDQTRRPDEKSEHRSVPFTRRSRRDIRGVIRGDHPSFGRECEGRAGHRVKKY